MSSFIIAFNATMVVFNVRQYYLYRSGWSLVCAALSAVILLNSIL